MAVRTLKEAWQDGLARPRQMQHSKGMEGGAPRLSPILPFDPRTGHEEPCVWTPGALPLDQLQGRLRWPACGNRTAIVFFEVPNEPAALAVRNRINPDHDEGRKEPRDNQ
jgi:hypothetical protein